jgi:hypothetical protein
MRAYCQFEPPWRLGAWRGQSHFETSAALRAIGGRDGSAVLVNDSLRDGEPEAGALGVQTRGDEGFKNVGQHVGGCRGRCLPPR